MENQGTPKFLELVRNPLQNLSRTNGWQRIWIALSGFMFICQVIYILFSIPNVFTYIEEKNNKQSEISSASEWIQKNKSMCESVAAAVEEAIAKNNAYNVNGVANYNNQANELRQKIQIAKDRLYKIEITGGMYYQDWASTKNQIEAHEKKLYSITSWVDRPFNYSMVENPAYREGSIRCGHQATVEKNATEELGNIKYRFDYEVSKFLSSLFATAISFVLVTTSVYLLGWGLGWIRKGFKSNK